jgi:WD repeat-containing protein 89
MPRDPRYPAAPLRTHASTHSDDITSLHFLPHSSTHPTILSASTDGLIATSDPSEDDEDEAVLHVANWGCSVAQAGWLPSRSGPPRVWSASDMETFSTWSHEVSPRSMMISRIAC